MNSPTPVKDVKILYWLRHNWFQQFIFISSRKCILNINEMNILEDEDIKKFPINIFLNQSNFISVLVVIELLLNIHFACLEIVM